MNPVLRNSKHWPPAKLSPASALVRMRSQTRGSKIPGKCPQPSKVWSPHRNYIVPGNDKIPGKCLQPSKVWSPHRTYIVPGNNKIPGLSLSACKITRRSALFKGIFYMKMSVKLKQAGAIPMDSGASWECPFNYLMLKEDQKDQQF